VNTEKTLRLIVLDDSSNTTETVSNILRNSGQVVRAERVEDDEDLRKVLADQQWDMVLAKPEIPLLSAREAMQIVSQKKLDLPLIIVSDGVDDDQLDALLKEGARDLVNVAQPERLTHTILREFGDLEHRRAQLACSQALQQTMERAQLLVDSSRDAIAYVHDGMHIYGNESYLEIFGFSELDEITGMPVLNMVGSEDHDKFKKYLRDYIKGKAKASSLEVHALQANGEKFDITMEFSPAHYEGEACTQIIIRTQAAEAIDSSRDPLTDLYNRQYFLDELDTVVPAGNQEGAVLFIVPDDYKKIRNDVGITASDQVLADFAHLLEEHLPGEKDFVARFENHKFTAILYGANESTAKEAAQSILDCITDHIFEAGSQSATTTCSVGIGLFNESIKDPQIVLSRAEKAVASLSQAGGNSISVYQPDVSEIADIERFSIMARKIKLALKNNRFSLLFQPVVSLKGSGKEHYEVLLRMVDEDGSQIAPADFIPAAEQSGLMVAIDRWVLANAIKVSARERRNSRNITFFIKISGSSLIDEKFFPWLRDLMKAANIEARSLVIEVSEKVAQNNLKSVRKLTEDLENINVCLALDHYGIVDNYATLLKHCDADFLKIDASLIRSIATDTSVLDKVKEIALHAKDAGKESVAVSVEDPNTLAMIYSTGVDYIQGYFLQAPSPELNYDFSSMG
jgi:diguanylate cyclase (GGDEF)-like protein/PAS domain S-box-containing protein